MMSDLKALAFLNSFLLPGEMAVTALIMELGLEYSILNWFTGTCALGIWFTINFFITAGFQAHVAEQKKAEQERAN